MSFQMDEAKQRRSLLLNGLGLVLRHPGAVVWTYVFNLGIAVLFSLSYWARVSSVLDHSLAAEGLNASFDLGTLLAVSHRLGYGAPSAGASAYAGLPVYFLVYFVLVPGALFGYRINAPGRLAIMASLGIGFFWRFVRIALLTLVTSLVVLVPMALALGAWGNWVTEHEVGGAQLWWQLPGWLGLGLVAMVLRLYWDMVEVYAVQLDGQIRPNGKPDRRVRRVLGHAARTLWRNFGRAYGVFLLIALLGAAEIVVTARAAAHLLPEPRVWPVFLLLQAGFFLNLLTRYWQRGCETILAADFLLPSAVATAIERDDTVVSARETFVYGEVRGIETPGSVLEFPQDELEQKLSTD
jgi:hypothetical protein